MLDNIVGPFERSERFQYPGTTPVHALACTSRAVVQSPHDTIQSVLTSILLTFAVERAYINTGTGEKSHKH